MSTLAEFIEGWVIWTAALMAAGLVIGLALRLVKRVVR